MPTEFNMADRMCTRVNGRRSALPASVTLVVLFFIFSLSLSVKAEEWRNFTNVNSANDLLPDGPVVWAATTGGLVLFTTDSAWTFTNADGLGGNVLSFVSLDSTGRLWTGGESGRLSSWDAESNRWTYFAFTDRDGRALRLTAAAADGDLLWVGSSVGVHKFNTEHFGGEITETYRRFGDLPADEEVHDVLITGDYIWVATSAGCAVARTDDINLQDYGHWRSFSSENSSLQNDDVVALAELHGTIFAATTGGLYTFSVDGPDSAWEEVPGSAVAFYDLYQSADEILGATANGIVTCSQNNCTFLPVEGMAEANSRAVFRSVDGILWAA